MGANGGALCHAAKGAAALLGALGVMAAASAFAGEWQEQSHPVISGRDEVLEDVAAINVRNIWAVGRHWGVTGGALEFRTHVLHWNGFQWSRSPSIDVEGAPATNFLQSVAARSATEVWAVGWSRRPGETAKTLIERWDGTDWSIVASPNPGPSGNYLEAVAVVGKTEAWAVGTIYNLSVVTLPLALHWDGSIWSQVDIPTPDFCVNRTNLTDIAAQRVNKILVTGYCTTSAGDQGFILRWNGKGWQVVIGPDQIPAPSVLHGVTFVSTTEAWAVGSSASGGVLILHWDGSTWATVAAPDAGPSASLVSVDADGPSNVWAVGIGDSSQPPFAGRLTMHWDGIEWTIEPAGDFGSLNGVGIAGKKTWAVGQNIDNSLIVWRRK